MSDWISVHDEIPDVEFGSISETMIVWNGHLFPAYMERVSDVEIRWVDTVDYEILGQVTHWMPVKPPNNQ